MDLFQIGYPGSAHYANTGNRVKLLGNVKNFLKDEGGNPTVEFVLWVPVFMFILIIVTDVSLALYRYSNLYYVARDTARQVAIRQLSFSEATTRAIERTSYSGNTPTVVVSASDDFNKVNVAIEVPINTVGIFATLSLNKDIKLLAVASANFEAM